MRTVAKAAVSIGLIFTLAHMSEGSTEFSKYFGKFEGRKTPFSLARTGLDTCTYVDPNKLDSLLGKPDCIAKVLAKRMGMANQTSKFTYYLSRLRVYLEKNTQRLDVDTSCVNIEGARVGYYDEFMGKYPSPDASQVTEMLIANEVYCHCKMLVNMAAYKKRKC